MGYLPLITLTMLFGSFKQPFNLYGMCEVRTVFFQVVKFLRDLLLNSTRWFPGDLVYCQSHEKV